MSLADQQRVVATAEEVVAARKVSFTRGPPTAPR